MEKDIELKVGEIIKNNIVYEGDVKQLYKEDFRKLGINSINFIKIVIALESEFDIEFDDEMLDNTMFYSFENIVSYVKEKCNV